MTQPGSDPFAAFPSEEPRLPQPDPIAWRYVILTAVLALIAVIGAMVVVQRHGSSADDNHATAGSLRAINAAATKTAALHATHMEMHMHMRGPQGNTVDISFGGDVSRHPSAGLITGTMPAGLGDIEERLVGHTVYMRLGNRTFGGRPWIGIDFVTDMSNAFGGVGDPLSMLRSLAGANSVDDLGTTTIDGVKTHHYRATLDPDTVEGALPDQFKVLPDSALSGMDSSMTEDLFLAPNGTVRRVENDVSVGAMTVTMQGDIRPISHAVVVTAPPASEVTHVANMAEAFQLMSSAS